MPQTTPVVPPPAQPRPITPPPQPSPAPAPTPRRERELDPFNPTWPKHRPGPEPKA